MDFYLFFFWGRKNKIPHLQQRMKLQCAWRTWRSCPCNKLGSMNASAGGTEMGECNKAGYSACKIQPPATMNWASVTPCGKRKFHSNNGGLSSKMKCLTAHQRAHRRQQLVEMIISPLQRKTQKSTLPHTRRQKPQPQEVVPVLEKTSTR